MKISNINPIVNFSNYKTKKEVEAENKNNELSVSRPLDYPKGYRPFFGARLHRSPENFYEQEFNKKGMPITIKEYLYKNYEVNSKKPPADLHKEAFEDLLLCENIDDVKEMFPQEFDENNPEALFTNLKTLETIRPTGGYLFQLRAFGYGSKKHVLKSGEDLTVYLLKKIFYECKDLDEINADFEKDRDPNPELERYDDYCNDEAYFLPSTIKSIGVRLPEKSYWKSLQANRTDKEYHSYTYTPKGPRKPREHSKQRGPRKVNLSPDEIKNRSVRMLSRWLEMTIEERQTQLAKMREGYENSVEYNYHSPIMYIATDKANLSDKMYNFFKENKEKLGVDAPEDIGNMDSKQAKAMKMFWRKNPKLKDYFSHCVKSTIEKFEKAKEQGDDAINELVAKAADIRAKNAETVIRRKLSDPEYAKENVRKLMVKQAFCFPDLYKEKYIEYVMNNDKFNNQVIPLEIKGTLAKTEEEVSECNKNAEKIMTDIYDDFARKNKRDAISASTAVAYVMRPYIINIAKSIYPMNSYGQHLTVEDANQTLTGGFRYIMGIIEKYDQFDIQNHTLNNKTDIDNKMSEFTSGFTEKELKQEYQKIVSRMDTLVNKGGNYEILRDYDVCKRCKQDLQKVYNKITRNKDIRNDFIMFLKDYEGLLKYVNLLLNEKCPTPDSEIIFNGKRITSSEYVRDYVYESIIDDYLIKRQNKK